MVCSVDSDLEERGVVVSVGDSAAVEQTLRTLGLTGRDRVLASDHAKVHRHRLGCSYGTFTVENILTATLIDVKSPVKGHVGIRLPLSDQALYLLLIKSAHALLPDGKHRSFCLLAQASARTVCLHTALRFGAPARVYAIRMDLDWIRSSVGSTAEPLFFLTRQAIRSVTINLEAQHHFLALDAGYDDLRPITVCRAALAVADVVLAHAAEEEKGTTRPSWAYPAVSRALEYIEKAEFDELSVTNISRHAGMSESRLRQLFREFTGEPIGMFVANFKLDRAYELIAEHGVSVTDASIQVGYNNIGYFSNRFRERFGIRPGLLKRSAEVVGMTNQIERHRRAYRRS